MKGLAKSNSWTTIFTTKWNSHNCLKSRYLSSENLKNSTSVEKKKSLKVSIKHSNSPKNFVADPDSHSVPSSIHYTASLNTFLNAFSFSLCYSV